MVIELLFISLGKRGVYRGDIIPLRASIHEHNRRTLAYLIAIPSSEAGSHLPPTGQAQQEHFNIVLLRFKHIFDVVQQMEVACHFSHLMGVKEKNTRHTVNRI